MSKKSENIEEVMEKLSALCRHLTDEQKELLRKHITIQDYKKNDLIYSEGDRPVYLFCLLSGVDQVYKAGVRR